MKNTVLSILLTITTLTAASSDLTVPDGDWWYYSRDHAGSRYSPVKQVNKSNVKNLKRAWTFNHGDFTPGNYVFECTPLVVDGVMYIITPRSRCIALDAATGGELWSYDPKLADNELGSTANRGVTYWKSGDKERIFAPAYNAKVASLDPKTGNLDESFGEGGVVDLIERMGLNRRAIFISSPPAVYGDIIIQGFGMPDASTRRMQPVPLIALNAHTGETVWTFNTIPQEGEEGAETWEDESWRDRGAANVWSIMSVDQQRGIVYLPATAAEFDFYGGDRPGDNLYSNCIVALDAKTGKRIWHYQTVHHDLWDYDIPAQPNLVEITVDGNRIPAVAQVSKTGFVYLLNRETGEPVFPIEERPVPQGGVPGERPSATQPMPSRPPAFTTQRLTEENLSRLGEGTYEYLLGEFKKLRSDGVFTPPTFEGTVVFPGFHGGANWSGAATGPDGSLYVNSTELACIIKLEKDADSDFGYRHTGWIRFRDQNGYPANTPPWGQLSKIDLNKGEIVWQKPLGEFEELTARGIPPTGQENFGGATVTAGGLVFIASTMDSYLRAFDAETGETLFKIKLDAAGYAAPVSYTGKDGKQYIAICAGGGGKLGTPIGDHVIAFCLDE